MKLNNKVIIVTGATSGIGKEIAYQLANKGAHLVLVARRRSLLKELTQDLHERFNVQVLIVVADLSEAKQIERLVVKAKKYFGRIDYLINSAGYGEFKPAVEFSYEEIQEMFKINTFAMMYLSQLVALEMLEQASGQIVFISSISGKLSSHSSSVYSASKSAIIGYADALRLELKKYGIGVTTINPGPVKTPFFTRNDTLQAYYKRIELFALETETVAKRVIDAMVKGKREVNMPFMLKTAAIISPLVPHISDFLNTNLFNFKEESR